MKIAIITSIIGKSPYHRGKIIDTLQDPIVVHKDVDYYAFMGEKVSNIKIWKQLDITSFSVIDSKFQNRRNAKIYKILPQLFLPNYDMYIWCDPTHTVVKSPIDIYNELVSNNAEAGFFKHNKRFTIDQEINELQNEIVEHKNLLSDYSLFIKNFDYKTIPLFTCSSFVTLNTNKCLSFRLTWNELINKFSSRDQISAPLSLYLHKVPHVIFPGNLEDITNNQYIKRYRYHGQ